MIPSPTRCLPRSCPVLSPSRTSLLQRALPGPQTTGQGLIPGSGSGGGGGAGGGSGGGAGRGIGPGTQFFGARDHAHSFAYVIDCSGSMASHATHWKLPNVKCLPVSTNFRPMPSLP